MPICPKCSLPTQRNQTTIQCKETPCRRIYHTPCVNINYTTTRERQDWSCPTCLSPPTPTTTSQKNCEHCKNLHQRRKNFLNCSSCSLSYHTLCMSEIKYKSNKINWICPKCSPPPPTSLTIPPAPIQKLQRGFKIGHVNERNILTKNKLHDTHEVILFHDFDVFACTETWLKPPIHDDELNLQNYNIFRQDRPGAKTGGGIMIYVKDCYEVTVIPTKYSAPLESLEIKIRNANMKPTHLIVIYRPKETPITLLQQMETDLISHSDKHTFLIGDFNIDNAKSTSLSCSLKSLVERNGFHQLINQPTRITEHSETIIDLIITNIAHLCSSFGVQSCTIADHELIYVVKKKPKDYRQPPKMINARDF